MAEILTLYSGPLSMFGAKVEIAMIEKGLPVDVIMVKFDMEKLYEPKNDNVLRINPKRQVPVLIDGDLELFDSTQIFEYVEDIAFNPRLWPIDPRERARARLLEHMSDEVYFPHVIRLMGLQDKLRNKVPDPTTVAALEACAAYYQRMERQLGDNDYLAGSYTYADIAFYMAALFGERMNAKMTDATPNLLAWRDRMGARPAVQEVVIRMTKFLYSAGRMVPPFMKALLAEEPLFGADDRGGSGPPVQHHEDDDRGDNRDGGKDK